MSRRSRVEDQPDGLALDGAGVEVARRERVALHRLVGVDRLRGVDADVADVLRGAVDPNLDRVPVDRAHDRRAQLPRAVLARGVAVVGVLAGDQENRAEDDQDDDRGEAGQAGEAHRPSVADAAMRVAR